MAASWRGPDDDEDGDRTHATPDTPTLRDHLRAQLSLTNLGARDRAFVEILIDALDDDGYLTQPLEEIAALLLPRQVAAQSSDYAEALGEELKIALCHLQHFEPAGVGARSPAECLTLQLKASGRAGAQPRARDRREAPRASRGARLHAAEGAHRRERGRAARGAAPDPGAQPAPGLGVREGRGALRDSDVIVKKVRNVWRASLNPDAMPRLRINRLYAELPRRAAARASVRSCRRRAG